MSSRVLIGRFHNIHLSYFLPKKMVFKTNWLFFFRNQWKVAQSTVCKLFLSKYSTFLTNFEWPSRKTDSIFSNQFKSWLYIATQNYIFSFKLILKTVWKNLVFSWFSNHLFSASVERLFVSRMHDFYYVRDILQFTVSSDHPVESFFHYTIKMWSFLYLCLILYVTL